MTAHHEITTDANNAATWAGASVLSMLSTFAQSSLPLIQFLGVVFAIVAAICSIRASLAARKLSEKKLAEDEK